MRDWLHELASSATCGWAAGVNTKFLLFTIGCSQCFFVQAHVHSPAWHFVCPYIFAYCIYAKTKFNLFKLLETIEYGNPSLSVSDFKKASLLDLFPLILLIWTNYSVILSYPFVLSTVQKYSWQFSHKDERLNKKLS